MKNRPVFSSKMSSKEFASYYWYKKELEIICKDYQLPSFGTKAELTEYVIEFLNGKATKDIKSVRKIRRKSSDKLTAYKITLDTKLLNSGFSLNNEARSFFANYFNTQKFSFRKSMAVKMREVEKNGDTEATVADLIKILKEKPRSNTNNEAEEKTYQWNKFVKDFRKDKTSSKYNDPLKVAAILWAIVRDSNNEKKYTHSLITNNESKISKYIK